MRAAAVVALTGGVAAAIDGVAAALDTWAGRGWAWAWLALCFATGVGRIAYALAKGGWQ